MKTHGAERAEERAVLKAAYEGGASIRALVAANGHSYGYAHDSLVETGTRLRGGGPNNRNPVPVPPEKAGRRRGSGAESEASDSGSSNI